VIERLPAMTAEMRSLYYDTAVEAVQELKGLRRIDEDLKPRLGRGIVATRHGANFAAEIVSVPVSVSEGDPFLSRSLRLCCRRFSIAYLQYRRRHLGFWLNSQLSLARMSLTFWR
jgi:hypothetical protein